MRTHTSRLAAAALAAALVVAAGCSSLDPIERPAPVTGNADFSSYVAIGTSITMGIQSNGLVEDLQVHAFPALVADAAGANGGSFVQPLVPTPGILPVLEVTGLTPSGLPIITQRPGTIPAGPSTPRPIDGYDNLGISGALVASALTKTTGDAPTNYFDLVLQGQGTIIRQCIAQRPTFVSVEFGSNELILAVLRGNPAYMIGGLAFQAVYAQLLDSLASGAPGAKLVLLNVTNLTDMAYATAIKLDVTGPYGPGGATVTIRLRDAAGPLPDGSRILLPAAQLIPQGYGFPSPAPPLPDSVVITPSEKATIDAAIANYNGIIAAAAQQRGAALADVHTAFARAHQDGIVVGGVRYTTSYVTGGLYSFDGVHPSSLGHGLIANEALRAINAKYGATIPYVDLAPLTQ
jgi:hypothetical protein